VLSRHLQEGKERAWELVSGILTTFLLFWLLVASLIFIFAHPLADILVPGFSSEAANQVARILQILMIQPILLSVSNVISSTLQTFRKFFIYSLAPVFYNVGIIIGILFFANFWGIWGVAWGVVLGALLHLLIQVPVFRSLGFKFSWQIRRTFASIKEVSVLMIPRALSLAAAQVNLLIITAIASMLPSGTLAIFNFADSLQGVPFSLLVISFATAAFPALAELWTKKDEENFRRIFAKTLSEIFIWTIPASLILLVFREPIVQFTLSYGSFDLSSQAKTVFAFSVYILSLPIQGLRIMLLRGFFATGDTRTPFISYLASTVVTIVSAFWLSQQYGAAGLVGGIVLGSIADSFIMGMIFGRRMKNLYLRQIARVSFRSIALGGAASLAGWLTFIGTKFLFEEETLAILFLRVVISVVPIGIILFAGVLMYKIFDLRAMAFSKEESATSRNES
jgi:putative peptidoglycan lipid II flippase